MLSAADLRAALVRWLPFLIVTAVGLYLLWPVPRGVMPLSADHTVHLTRAALYGEQLAGGHTIGWNQTWFFGFPLGELYPVLGDLGVSLLRVLSLGLLDWPQAYALTFTLVFLAQGWVLLRAGRAIGWGPVPGTIAALLMLTDVGSYREGGWIYTVTYGVWPQALATSLAWLAFAELTLACRAPPPTSTPTPPTSNSSIAPFSTTLTALRAAASSASPPRPGRHLAVAALAAAAALLAHPMALMMLALGAPLFLATVGLRGADEPPTSRRDTLATTARHLGITLAVGLALAAWWLLPMTAHSGWMASYGWLHMPLHDMLRMASHGQWTFAMPAAVGHGAALGLVAAALLGRGPLRFFAAWTVLHWLLASADAFWSLRLDHLSASFSHIQYQRFLIAAKPGIFLLAGAAVGGLIHLALRTWPKRHGPPVRVHATLPSAQAPQKRRYLRPRTRKALAAALAALALALAAWQAAGVRAAAARHHVGEVQLDRIPNDPAFAIDYAAFLAWARARWDARETDYRIAVRADRNAHWFMDSPVTTHTPTYKLGFTPGDNFVHKPESGDPTLLRRLGVRFLLTNSPAGPPGSTKAAQFGKLHVFELAARDGLAHLEPATSSSTPAADPASPTSSSPAAEPSSPTSSSPASKPSTSPSPGTVTVEHADFAAGLVRARVTGSAPTDRLVFHVAGYPRWDLTFQPDGGAPEPVGWIEVPVLGAGPGATPDDRRAGRLRGGKALGDDGREPTLIAAPARDGVFELRYVRWRPVDVLGLALGLAALAALIVLARTRSDPLAGIHRHLRRLTHPAVVVAALSLALALVATRTRRAVAREYDLASARLDRGEATATRMSAGPLKTDMLIFPAVLATPGRAGTSELTLSSVRLGDHLDGWYALDDDDAKLRRRGNHRLTISASPPGAAVWTTLFDAPVPHRPDRNTLAATTIPQNLRGAPVDLHVVVTTTGEQPPRLGFDLRLP